MVKIPPLQKKMVGPQLFCHFNWTASREKHTTVFSGTPQKCWVGHIFLKRVA
jgi:hypothetical protein